MAEASNLVSASRMTAVSSDVSLRATKSYVLASPIYAATEEGTVNERMCVKFFDSSVIVGKALNSESKTI